MMGIILFPFKLIMTPIKFVSALVGVFAYFYIFFRPVFAIAILILISSEHKASGAFEQYVPIRIPIPSVSGPDAPAHPEHRGARESTTTDERQHPYRFSAQNRINSLNTTLYGIAPRFFKKLDGLHFDHVRVD